MDYYGICNKSSNVYPEIVQPTSPETLTILESNGLRPQYNQALPTTISMLISLTPFTTMD